jgi:hypothetical protein
MPRSFSGTSPAGTNSRPLALGRGQIRRCREFRQHHVADRGPLLSRLHRRAEALDEACLRAWGHPHDHAIQQELLNALELDGSLHPEHARRLIRDLFKQVHDLSVDRSNRIRSAAGNPDGAAHLIFQGIQSLRRSLAALVQVVAARHSEPRTD